MADAIVLSGAVAKGAFTAGALSVLMARQSFEGAPIDIRHIVGTSSGALNGTYVAHALAAGTPWLSGPGLTALWDMKANAWNVARPLLSALPFRGFSTSEGVHRLLRDALPPVTHPHNGVRLSLIVSSTRGFLEETTSPAGEPPRTTYEYICRFGSDDFATKESLERVFTAAMASSAFPFAFLPVKVKRGPDWVECFDGGVVNNAPIKIALEDKSVTRIFLVDPYPAVDDGAPPLTGFGLLGHVADMLVHERLYRDLREAKQINDALLRLRKRVRSSARRDQILEAIGWGHKRPIQIVEIRPQVALRGTAFSGFLQKSLRAEYIRLGEAAAERVLGTGEKASGRFPQAAE